LSRSSRRALATLLVASAAAIVSLPLFLGYLQSQLHYQCEFVGIDRQFQCQDGASYIGIGIALVLSIIVVLATALGAVLPVFQRTAAARWSALILVIASILPWCVALLATGQARARDVAWPDVLGVVPSILLVGTVCSVLAAAFRGRGVSHAFVWLSVGLYVAVVIVQYELLMSASLSVGILLCALYFLPARERELSRSA